MMPCVMIIDDDRDVRDLLSGRFAAHGYEVITAENGAEAIHKLQSGRVPDIVFVDLLMPGVIGGSVLEFMRSDARFRRVQIAVVTGSPHLAPDGPPVFTKPVSFETLLAFAHARHPSEHRLNGA